jgi:RNA polymerase-interacting CarD/CdnL/TRCF family regulator
MNKARLTMMLAKKKYQYEHSTENKDTLKKQIEVIEKELSQIKSQKVEEQADKYGKGSYEIK